MKLDRATAEQIERAIAEGRAVVTAGPGAGAQAKPARAVANDLPGLIAAVVAAGFPEPVPEHRFHPTRKWRFDLAWPGAWVAFEREGLAGGPYGSRHQKRDGFAADCEKYSTAAVMGWCVVRATGRQIASGAALALVLRALAERRDRAAQWDELCGRIAAQSEILSRKAERT